MQSILSLFAAVMSCLVAMNTELVNMESSLLGAENTGWGSGMPLVTDQPIIWFYMDFCLKHYLIYIFIHNKLNVVFSNETLFQL